jgi:multidrug efflux pump subunit AcrA (membrane-fusion protein)
VPTYRTVLLFSTIDPRIKSGMTANLTIHGDSREGVLAVPQRAVISHDGQNIVEKVIDGKTVDTPVETGLRGSEGTIEILSGLNEGDQVVASPSATDN